MDAVFRDTRQALHLSFLILSCEPRRKSTLRLALIEILESLGTLSRRQAAWLEQLYGEPSSTVNFSGLTADEVRGQCAEVESAVRSKLLEREQWAIWARFGQMGEERLPDGTNRLYFLRERSEAIQHLSAWLVPEFTSVSELAMDCIIARHYVSEKKAEISFRDLEASFGASRMTYKRAYDAIRSRLHALENGAVDKLADYFERTGLIEPRETERS
ncbi:hypothetical protein [Paraburkholderia caballeronis]|uniref:hypothetical protein n=1 Tax=Paraburkholderia caballeronis TaxID=416943 RepID=UPI0010660D17|nr:hypothetical protein [Paraburkholderia caballeronis]TDV04673.1 hypothetical protein C7408_13135 [Paraburkholderia caballeronis]TDV07916.1 hypothetical protein C7406_13335 [Paraburkholderia caballeronis]TDV18207.1 hypothetical protein C7404_13135 [Paraburkholderia caballeronis]